LLDTAKEENKKVREKAASTLKKKEGKEVEPYTLAELEAAEDEPEVAKVESKTLKPFFSPGLNTTGDSTILPPTISLQ
jgi:hypothetical protein